MNIGSCIPTWTPTLGIPNMIPPWTSVIYVLVDRWILQAAGFPIYGIPLGKPTLLRWLSSRRSWLPKRWSWRKRDVDAFFYTSESPFSPILDGFTMHYNGLLGWYFWDLLVTSPVRFFRDWATRIRSTVSSSWKRALPDDCRLLTSRLQRSTRKSLRGLGGWGLVAGWWHKLCPNRKGDFKKNHYFSWGLDGDFHQETHGFHRLMGNSRGDSSFAKPTGLNQAWHGDPINSQACEKLSHRSGDFFLGGFDLPLGRDFSDQRSTWGFSHQTGN